MSEIPTIIINAYLETDYYVYSNPPFILHVNIECERLAKLYKLYHTDSAAFISACNPFSQNTSEAINTAKQAELAGEIIRHGLTLFNGIGRHPASGWPEEPSFLALGLPLETAKQLGQNYRQNAILWCGGDAIPKLILLR